MAQGSYYVPDQSKFPLFASIGLFLTVYGAANWINGNSGGMTVFFVGGLVLATVLFNWFGTTIKENMAGLNSAQLKRSYVWGMGWFIFSEVMFFAAFFGALFYIRQLAVPWLAGEGANANTHQFLWPEFENNWPLLTTPQEANADNLVYQGSKSFEGAHEPMGWKGLPLWNTVILLTSSFTVHFAHTALKNANRKMFNIWLGITVLLGISFLVLQVEEYVHAYQELGLTLNAGVYGTTFFMLTGFHGAHVTLGTFMLLVMLLRGFKGHFKHDDCFGFEAASWYWHFVDVVWLGLFIFVYILGS